MECNISLEDIQNVELDVLAETLRVLEKHNIRSFLAGGTCLGYVRHNGFIPWDDDIDIMLFREDYEKACKVLRDELPEGYFFTNYYVEKEYPYNFAKVRKNNTAFVHGGDVHLNINHGIYIDLFPLDYAPSDISKFKRQCKIIRFMRNLVDLHFMSYKKYGKIRPFWALPLIFIGHWLINGKQIQYRIDSIIESGQRNIDKTKVVSYMSVYANEIHDVSIFGNGKLVDFCGVKAFIPQDERAYLTNLYGNYMQLPPEEKRVSHHDIVFISLTESYKGKE